MEETACPSHILALKTFAFSLSFFCYIYLSSFLPSSHTTNTNTNTIICTHILSKDHNVFAECPIKLPVGLPSFLPRINMQLPKKIHESMQSRSRRVCVCLFMCAFVCMCLHMCTHVCTFWVGHNQKEERKRTIK